MGLFDFIAQDGGLFEILVFDGLAQFLLQLFEPVREIARLPQRLGHLADMVRAFMHGLEQAFEGLGEGLVTLRTTEPARLLEIGLRESAAGALDLRPAAGLLDLLRGPQPEQQIRQRKSRRIVHSLGFGAFLAQVHLLHFVPGDLSQVDGGLFFFADAAQHNIYSYIGSPEALVKEWYWAISRAVTGPGLPLPITRPSIFTTGIISAPVPVRKHSSALNKS